MKRERKAIERAVSNAAMGESPLYIKSTGVEFPVLSIEGESQEQIPLRDRIRESWGRMQGTLWGPLESWLEHRARRPEGYYYSNVPSLRNTLWDGEEALQVHQFRNRLKRSLFYPLKPGRLVRPQPRRWP